MSVTHGKDTANEIDFLLVMGRADLECKFTSFSKDEGISLELVQSSSPVKDMPILRGR